MKFLVFTWRLLFCAAILYPTIACKSQPVSILFDNEKLVFPITVKEAVTRYKLSFNPPGYYYRKDRAKELYINIVYQNSDYYNENQPKEVLYNHEVVSYVFKYDGGKIKSDSVKFKVERLCGCQLTFIRDSLSAKNDPGFNLSPANLPLGGYHQYALAKLNQDVTVGFRNKPNYQGEIIPEVRFFYKQSPSQIRKWMMQY